MTRHVRTAPPRGDADTSTPEAVRNEAADIATSAAERAGEVTDVLGDQARAVVSETGRHTRQLLEQGVDQLRGQARDGQRKAADGLRSLAEQLHNMSERTDAGIASDVARQVSERASSAASWLDSREPGDLVNELRNFAQRRPGVFITGAAFTGMLVGRLTRNMVTAAKKDEPRNTPTDGTTTPGHRSPSGPVLP